MLMKSKGEGNLMREILSFSKGFMFLSVVLVFEALSNVSCTKTSEFTIGKDFLEAETNVTVVDTFKTSVSTIFLDSLISSGSKLAYTGYYRDSVFGSLNCESYFDMKYTEFEAPGDRASFDSAAFIFTYSKTSYGDTTSAITIGIHELTENITTFADGYIYNNSHFSYAPYSIAERTFYPYPHSADTILKIPANAYGDDLFTLIKNGDSRISSADQFNDFIKGFVMIPDTTLGNSVIGFKADEAHVLFRIYYHFEDVGPVEKEITINMGDVSHQFNRVRTDFSGTLLEGIKSSHIIPSGITNNRAYMQGLTGLMPKIQFPTVQNLFLASQWKVLRAELIVSPVAGSYGLFPLPTKLYIYDTDKSNIIKNILTDSKGNTLTADFNYDRLYNEDTRYTYLITNFINAELSDNYFDPNHALSVGLNESGLKSTLDRLVIECNKPAITLKLYYLTY
jgi:hypothetical protein